MDRKITGYIQDAASEWIARLECGHRQHVRHRPPFFNRPWICSEVGRSAMVGQGLDCLLCDQLLIPEGYTLHSKSKTFSTETLPGKLSADHTLALRAWGRLVVEEGIVRYHLLGKVLELSPEVPGIIPPAIPHFVKPEGHATFHIEFYRSNEE
jgi:hypothetical protein